ncbi:hypothetical protein AB0A77_04160 [Streptomyces varsoviensis]
MTGGANKVSLIEARRNYRVLRSLRPA